MLEGVPNLAMAVGYTNASWTLKCDLTCRYVTRLLNHLRDSRLRRCTPVNDDPSVEARPLLGLTSGYVQRSQDRFPKQGSVPGRCTRATCATTGRLRLRGIQDGAMRFTNPAPDPAARCRSSVAGREIGRTRVAVGLETGGHGDHRPREPDRGPRLVHRHLQPPIVNRVNDYDVRIAHALGDHVARPRRHRRVLPRARRPVRRRPARGRRHRADRPLRAGDTFVVPRGTEHRPSSPGSILMFEPSGTSSTGDHEGDPDNVEHHGPAPLRPAPPQPSGAGGQAMEGGAGNAATTAPITVTQSNRSRHSVMRPSSTSKVPHTQNAARSDPRSSTSVRSVRTVPPSAAMLWSCA